MRYFYSLWGFAYLLKDTKSLVDIAGVNKNVYSLYDIVCYTYLLLYGEKYDIPDYWNECNKDSIRKLVLFVSYCECVGDNRENENDGDDDNYSDESSTHFDTYKKTSLRRLYRFFDFIFEKSNSIEMFGQGEKDFLTLLIMALFRF